MTDEQATIEILNSLIKVNKDFFENQGDMLINKRDIEALETVLNTLKEKDKEIEYWKNGFERELEDNRKNTCELLKQDLLIKEKDSEIEELKKALARNVVDNFTTSMKETTKAKDDLEMLAKGYKIELEKKNKIIDLILDKVNLNYAQIFDNSEAKEIIEIYEKMKNTNNLSGLELRKSCIKQYFKQKATNNVKSDKNVAEDRVIAHKFAVMQQQLEQKEKRIQELEEENTILKKASNIAKEVNIEDITDVINESCKEFMSNYIPKQAVIDKIKELDIAILECEYDDDDVEEYKNDVEKEKRILLIKKSALEELLEEK